MMKKITTLIVFCFILIVSAEAQNPDHPLGISFKTLFMDYQSQNGGSISSFREYHPGFEIGFHKKINQNLNLVIPLKFGVVTSNDSLNNISESLLSDETRRLHKTIAALMPRFNISFISLTLRLCHMLWLV